MRSRTLGSNISSDFLDNRLKKALDSRNLEETKFRANHVYQWTIMFCDTSRSVKKATEVDDDYLKELTADYRELVATTAQSFNPPFMDSGDGPQLVICFEKPEHAADAAIEIQTALKKWRYRDDGGQYFRPSIGLHSGDFVIVDDDLKQSNACNLGKRIETQAESGQIFVSLSTYETLKSYSNYKMKFDRETLVKNIPEPQKIYAILWQESNTLTQTGADGTKVSKNDSNQQNNSEGQEDIITEGNMGLLICDVAGSTRKFWNLGDREGNLLIEIFRKEVFLILKKHRAIHIEIREGDMIVACFSMDKPIVNVLAAVEIQKNFFTRNVNLGSRTREKLETSIGIHIGNMMIRNDEIVPTPAFFACKGIQDMAEANEITLTEEVAKLITEYSHLPLVEAGEADVKGFDEPLKVYSLEWFKKKETQPMLQRTMPKQTLQQNPTFPKNPFKR